MKLEIESYHCFCALSLFKINDIDARYEDFGDKEDTCPDEAEPYGCGNMEFLPYPPNDEILDKYKITVDEYDEICEELVERLSFGCCSWCV